MRTKHETGALGNAYRNQPCDSAKNPRSGLARKSRSRLAAVTTAGLALFVFSQGALAANPTYEIVGPSEWNLPIVSSANVFIQTGIGQTSGEAWNLNGNRQDIPSTHLIAGITRFAHLFSFKALPNTGFFWEVLVPEISVYGHGNSVSGLGDPLLDLTAYWKPTPQSLVGFQNIVSTTFGSNDLSNHFWEYMPSFIGDINFAKWELDGTLGAGFASDRHVNGTTTRIGNTYYAQASVLYHVTDAVAPFVNFNYQNVKHSTDKATGAIMPGAAPVFACADNGGCHENVVGAGVKWNFSPKRWLAVWYSAGVSGRNTVRTNAAYLRFVNIF